MEKFTSEIIGHLDIFVSENEDELNGENLRWKQILIHGDPNGLKSLAKLLINLAELNQENINHLPTGARVHIHLRRKIELSNSSDEVIIGRIDAKGTGGFYDRYVPKVNS
jgi:hypothetical protein